MKGKVTLWKDDKGFGFIQPDDGSEQLFFHVSSVKTNARRPQVGDRVLYEPMRDSQQRLKAKGVVIEGVKKSSSTSPVKRPIEIEPPKKNIVDYVSILVALISIAAAGFEFYSSSAIESSWPFVIPAVISFFILNRQKKPREKSFSCSRCRKIAEYDARTIQAWNNGFTKLYCGPCHHQWLKDNPRHQQGAMHNQGRGCLGVLALLVIMPVLGGIGLYQWLA
ncbi:cold shock domain-containing protein [Marinobacterium sediminicola]|uniref:Cold shock protein, CspA family n=1 Tax=Marinobacterium sediminicola TaxID=518898 RepID=A0ABY1RWP6_9GAMM|nr:cold shock domain-containing protein [Marinobacterium sediminicola]ULG70232.1 cold shock domain-containing protein [Marinobacterium sediminicola]SMR70028.1 Cold shock protein, CspA family [Marinobacterium sediminicola]